MRGPVATTTRSRTFRRSGFVFSSSWSFRAMISHCDSPLMQLDRPGRAGAPFMNDLTLDSQKDSMKTRPSPCLPAAGQLLLDLDQVPKLDFETFPGKDESVKLLHPIRTPQVIVLDRSFLLVFLEHSGDLISLLHGELRDEWLRFVGLEFQPRHERKLFCAGHQIALRS